MNFWSLGLTLLLLTGCNSTKWLSGPSSSKLSTPLQLVSNAHLTARLEAIFCHDGFDPTRRKTNHHEYVLSVKNTGRGSLQIAGISVDDTSNPSKRPTHGEETDVVIQRVSVNAAEIYRGVKNERIDQQIESKRVQLPFVLREEQVEQLHVFFPETSSPGPIKVIYQDAWGQKMLLVDNRNPLPGKHVPARK